MTTAPARALDLAEEILTEQVVGPLAPAPALEPAIRALDRGTAVSAVVEQFGTTATPFIRRSTGPPAVEQGYCDQSHLVHDFSSITGIAPSAYRPRSADAPNHLPV